MVAAVVAVLGLSTAPAEQAARPGITAQVLEVVDSAVLVAHPLQQLQVVAVAGFLMEALLAVEAAAVVAPVQQAELVALMDQAAQAQALRVDQVQQDWGCQVPVQAVRIHY